MLDIPIADWDKMHVARFVAGLKFPFEIQQILVEQDIDGVNLVKMKLHDFKDIGIVKRGNLVALRDAVDKLKKLNQKQVEEKFRKKYLHDN